MILVTLGTQDKSFERLLKAVQKEINSGNIKDKVVVQAGYTKFKSKDMEIFELVPIEEFDTLIKKCDLLITHGGVGSIIAGLKNNKKVIAVPRLKKFGEHTNDHQLQIIKNFSNAGYILELNNFNKLGEVIKESKSFKPKKYNSNTKNMINLITSYINNDSKKFHPIRRLLLFVIILLLLYLLLNNLK